MADLNTAIEEMANNILFDPKSWVDVESTPEEVTAYLKRLQEFEKIGVEPKDLLSIVSKMNYLKGVAESVQMNRDSIFSDEKLCAESEMEEILDSLTA